MEMIDLDLQLKTFKILYAEKTEGEQPCIKSMRITLQSLSCVRRGMVDIVFRGFHILLVMPAANPTSEKHFSAIQGIKILPEQYYLFESSTTGVI